MESAEYQLIQFSRMLIEENKNHNLISRQSTEEDIARHISDSIEGMKLASFQGKKVIDIGSGAGFPGMVLAICNPTGLFTLVESDLKKGWFLERVKSELGLNNVDLISKRVEEVGQDQKHRESFDFCTARAVAAISVLLEYGIPLLKVGGELLLWKGKKYLEEMEQAKKALQILGASVKGVYRYNSDENDKRVLISFKKLQPTSDKYPRRVGIPSKRPL
ncbi:MAG: 16S rRNA (guanine(527)-N(7))-methyltransferase RsmG [Syntrophomonadaceae bacterium]|nr:16S rRNA (guanine(527)-N(7))-methyltransferase RsmG [Syntrophomonadaceae bacterium]